MEYIKSYSSDRAKVHVLLGRQRFFQGYINIPHSYIYHIPSSLLSYFQSSAINIIQKYNQMNYFYFTGTIYAVPAIPTNMASTTRNSQNTRGGRVARSKGMNNFIGFFVYMYCKQTSNTPAIKSISICMEICHQFIAACFVL